MVEALRSPALRSPVLAVALIGGLDAVEEYFPVLAGEWGVATTAVPFAVLGIALAGAAGAALGGRADRLPGARLLGAARVGGGLPRGGRDLGPAGRARRGRRLLRASTWRCWWWPRRGCRTGSPAPHRATITSVAGLGIELAALLVFAAWALGGPLAVAVLVLAVVPVAALGLRVPVGRS